jgi:hypothetical protein
MINRFSFFLLFIPVFLAGCAGDSKLIHSPSYAGVKGDIAKLDNEYAESKDMLSSLRDNITPTIIQFGVIDGFYVNTSGVDRRRKKVLPEDFNDEIKITTSGTMDSLIAELSDFIFSYTGVNVVIESPNEPEEKAKSSSSTEKSTEAPSTKVADLIKTPAGTEKGKSLKETFGVVDKATTSATTSALIEPTMEFEFEGKVSELINRMATLQKMKWKYNSINGDIVFYNLITKNWILPMPPSGSSGSVSVSSSAGVSGDSTTGSTSASLSSSTSSDPWKSVESALKSMISRQGRYFINKETGAVDVTELYGKINTIDTYLNSIIDLYSSQLLVDVRVVHLANNASNSKEINWTSINNKIGSVIASSTFGNTANITSAASLLLGYKSDPNSASNNISAAIDLLSTYAESYSVDSFSAITTNFTAVPIQISSEAVYFTKSTETDESGNTDVTYEPTTKQLGTTITLTPAMIEDYINLTYVFQKTAQTALVEDPNGAQYPLTSTKTFYQNVKLKNGIPMVISAVNSRESSNNAASPLATGAWFLGGSEASRNSETKDIVLVTVSKLRQNLTDHKKNYYDEDVVPVSDYLLR